MTTLGIDIFYYAYNLESLSVEKGNPVFDSRDNCNAIIETETNTLRIGCAKTKIPNTVTALGDMAFSGKPGLIEVNIPNSVTSLGWAVFWADQQLSKVKLSASITNMGSSPFGGCDRITSFEIDEGNPNYDSRNNCNAIIEKATDKLIQGFATTKIPDGVKTIATAAFRSMSTLTEIEIPASVQKIEAEAFLYCNQMTKVVSHIRKPFAVSSMVFSGDNMETAKLYVPYGTKEAYANTPGWDNFRRIIEMDPVEGDYLSHAASVTTTDFGKAYAELNGKVTVPVSLTGEGLEPVTSIDYTITTGSSSISRHLELTEPVNFMMQAEVLITLDADATTGEHNKVFTLTKVNGVANECTTENMKATGKLVTVAKKPKVVPVVEEATGTWCGWCARGIPSLALLNKVYKGDVITIAVHGGGSGDPMILDNYQLPLGSYPSCMVNRGTGIDPYYGSNGKAFGISREIEAAQRSYVPAGIEIEADWADGAQKAINIKTTTTFVEDISKANYRIGYVLLEDGLTGTDPVWYQSNYYAGSAVADANLVNLTKAEAKITNVVYNHIPVAAYNPFDGIVGSLPATIKKDVAMVHDYKINISGNDRIQDKKKLSVVALLIDNSTGKIINAAKFKFNKDDDTSQSGFQFLTNYAVKVAEDIQNGTVVADKQSVTGEKEIVTLTVKPADNYSVGKVTVRYTENGNAQSFVATVAADDASKYTFAMPNADVTVTANFLKLLTHPDITISEIENQACTGGEVKPAVVVKDGESVITDEWDISFADNTLVGTATVTIKAKASSRLYSGETTKTFEIMRKMESLFGSDDQWTGYVAQEDLKTPDGLTAYIVTAINSSEATVAPLTYIPQGVPVLLMRADKTANLFMASAGNGSEPTENLLRVNTEDKPLKAKECYVVYRDEFVLNSSGVLPAGRVYLPAVSGTRKLSIGFEGGLTVIDGHERSDVGEDVWYTFDGHKLYAKPTKKGYYIHNNSKEVVR